MRTSRLFGIALTVLFVSGLAGASEPAPAAPPQKVLCEAHSARDTVALDAVSQAVAKPQPADDGPVFDPCLTQCQHNFEACLDRCDASDAACRRVCSLRFRQCLQACIP